MVEISNGSGVSSRSWEVVAGSGPTIESFSVGPSVLSLGEALTASWTVGPDPDGEAPTLLLRDDRGAEHVVTGPIGDLRITPPSAGSYAYTLHATTSSPHSIPAQATATVEVVELPSLEFIATPQEFDDTKHDEVILSWTTTSVDRLTLFEIVGDGAPSEVLEVQEADIAAGSFGLIPTRDDLSYRLVGWNRAGSSTESTIPIRLAPPTVQSFTAEPTTVVAGQRVTLNWQTSMATERSLDILDGAYVREEIQAPYLDLESTGGTHLPMTQECPGVLPEDRPCAYFEFPIGFSFPFNGVRTEAMRVYEAGVLSFMYTVAQGSSVANTDFPTTSPDKDFAHLAPFWGRFGWDNDAYPEGRVYFTHRRSPDGDSLVIQWKEVTSTRLSVTYSPASKLSFNVVLWENGNFEYRYGEADAAGDTETWVNGEEATIGYQLQDKSSWDLLNYYRSPAVSGPLQDRAFRYRPAPEVGASGSYVWFPYASGGKATATLVAARGALRDEETVEITVLPAPTLELTRLYTEPLPTDESVRIGWRTTGAEKVEVFDDAGARLCEVTSAPAVRESFCALTGLEEGTYSYRVRASGPLGTFVDRTQSVTIYAPFSIDRFEADAEVIRPGMPVSLSWFTTNAYQISLMANGVELLPYGATPGPGEHHIPSLDETTTYTLRVTNQLGLTVEESVVVQVEGVVFTATPNKSLVTPGEEVQVQLSAMLANDEGPARIYGNLPMQEVTDAAFLDLRNERGAAEIFFLLDPQIPFHQVTELPLPFPFPYFGEEYQSLGVSPHGYLAFPGGRLEGQNHPFPRAESRVHLAPFWDDLSSRMEGEVQRGRAWFLQSDADTFIIQWSGWSMSAGSADGSVHDLNFQVVLKRDGAFDFRYGTMDHLKAPQTSESCFPSTCENEAKGASATIGYQSPDGVLGFNLHFGGSSNSIRNAPFPGGLANRTFRYQPVLGEATLSWRPTTSGTYRLCAPFRDEEVCRSFDIEVDFGIDSFEVSATRVPFNGQATFNWKTRGGDSIAIWDEDGIVFQSDAQAVVDQGLATITPSRGGTFTLVLSAPGTTAGASVELEVVRVALSAELSKEQVFPGTPVTLTWNLEVNDPSFDPYLLTPMYEARDRPFSQYDLSLDPDATVILAPPSGPTTSTVLTFDEDFTFPYFGEDISQVVVTPAGYLNVTSTNTQVLTGNGTIPQGVPSSTPIAGRIAPFWEYLHYRLSGSVLAKRVNADTYVIQWNRMSLNFGSSDTNEGSLNFQVVLHRSGSFEFRYGLMQELLVPTTVARSCYPETCINETNGSSASIGFQNHWGDLGFNLHQGETNPTEGAEPVPGGLSHRTWVFDAAKSSGSMVINPADTVIFDICVFDHGSDEKLCVDPVVLRADWGIRSFTASPSPVRRGSPVEISWDIVGLDELILKRDGVTMVSYTGGAIPPETSTLQVTPTQTSLFTLEGKSLGREVYAERLVEILGFDLEITVPSAPFVPGQKVQLSWEMTPLEPGPVAVTSPMVEIPAGVGEDGHYVDISEMPGVREAIWTGSTNTGQAAIELPFSFPYFGRSYDRVQATVDGFLSFDTDTAYGVGANTQLPTLSNVSQVHLAIFWDDLFRRGTNDGRDKIWTYQPDPDTFIIQYTNFNRNQGSSANGTYFDLNFQVVLFSDGSFEYRYGTMAAPPGASHAACYPSSCEEEAQGSSATIGYQIPELGYATMIHYGGQGAANVKIFEGGLSGRTFRFAATPTGSVEITPERSEELLVCGAVGAYRECRKVWVEAVADPGDLAITELMISPAAGGDGQWFEVRNLSNRIISLDGFEVSIASDEDPSGSFTIPAGKQLLPGAYFTFAASASTAVNPDHVYGTAFSLSQTVETLSISAGTSTIASVRWNADWTIPSGQTLHLDNSFQHFGVVAHDDFGRWCQGSAAGTPGAGSVGCFDETYDVDTASSLPFIDISTTGTRVEFLEWASRVQELEVPGFSFPFFNDEEEESVIWVGTNGYITFVEALRNYQARNAPTSLPMPTVNHQQGPLVAVFWDRIACNPALFSCSFAYQHDFFGGQEMLIVQWTGYRIGTSATSNTPGSVTVQAQLWRDGTIVIAFAEVESEDPAWSPASAQYRGGSAWVGIHSAGEEYLSGHFRNEADLSHRTFEFRRK